VIEGLDEEFELTVTVEIVDDWFAVAAAATAAASENDGTQNHKPANDDASLVLDHD
jgi:hypothetical protein